MEFKTLVLGIGNSLLSDEGAGVHVIRFLEEHYSGLPGVEYLDGGTLSFTLAESIARADGLIVVDAARLDAEPGTIRLFEGEAMDRYLHGNRSSVHEVGIADLLDMARLTGVMPRRRCLVGIQPHSLDWGESPTPMVAAAIPQAARLVLERIRAWNDEAGSSVT